MAAFRLGRDSQWLNASTGGIGKCGAPLTLGGAILGGVIGLVGSLALSGKEFASTHFMGKYSQEFAFENRSVFGATNSAIKRKINFLKMTTEAIEALTETELSEALEERGVDVSKYNGKEDLVNKALMM